MAYPVSISREDVVTSEGLIGIAVFTAFAFFVSVLLVDETMRVFTLGLGGLILLAIVGWIAILFWQRRYGTSMLYAVRELEPGQPFEGVIEAELRTPPAKPIRLRVYVWTTGRYTETLVRARIDPLFLRETARRTAEIPFRVEIPPGRIPRAYKVRLSVRTASWPVGWGATFLLRDWFE